MNLCDNPQEKGSQEQPLLRQLRRHTGPEPSVNKESYLTAVIPLGPVHRLWAGLLQPVNVQPRLGARLKPIGQRN